MKTHGLVVFVRFCRISNSQVFIFPNNVTREKFWRLKERFRSAGIREAGRSPRASLCTATPFGQVSGRLRFGAAGRPAFALRKAAADLRNEQVIQKVDMWFV